MRFARLRRSQTYDEDPEDRKTDHRFDTPNGYTKRASEPRFRRSEALSHTWWQVKDSNLRSFRDGFTVLRLQARDQRKRLTRNNLRAYSPQAADDHRLQPDIPTGNVYVNGGRVSTSAASTTTHLSTSRRCEAQGLVRYRYFSDNRTTLLACRDGRRTKVFGTVC